MSNPANPERVNAAYAMWAEIEDGPRTAGAIGLHELMRFLSDGRFQLSGAQSAYLFGNPRLRADYQALKRRLAARDLPMVAAASGGDVLERSFSGGQLQLTPSASGPQVYLLISFAPEAAPTGASALIVEAPDGRLGKLELPAPDEAGEIYLLLNPDNGRDRDLLALLRDPLATGVFVPLDAAP